MTLLEALLEAAAGRRTVERTALWRAFQKVHPLEAASGEARERLVARLQGLQASGEVELPSLRGSGWDHSTRPATPEWIRLPRPRTHSAEVDLLSIPWAPELGFVPGLDRVDNPQEILAIQAFFAGGGRERPMVPLRERSVELFGDEKRLEHLLRTPIFAEGRLTLEKLRCFAMAPPLVLEVGPAATHGKPAIVLENHHTWWSFARWNRTVGQYSLVVYGAGSAFGRETVLFLAERCRAEGAPFALYFGDLDPEGLAIPTRAAGYAEAHGLRLFPATRWYLRVLERAETVRLPTAAPLEEKSIDWLPEALRGPVERHFREGRRIPQELVGTEVLGSEGWEDG